MDRIFFQHRRGYLRHQLSVGTPARSLGDCGSIPGTGNTRRIWSHADRRQFPVQRRGAAVLGIAIGSHRSRWRIQNFARQPDDRLRYLDDRTQPLDLFRARLLCSLVLWRWLCHNAIFCPRRFWQQKNVQHLRGNSNRLGSSGNLRTALCGIPERPISRPRSHILLLNRDLYARPRLRLLLFAKRRPHSP